ncbi:MAG TPA: dioxygenase [Candidatus Binataceae bacterium]|jgi:catechol 1,2-dioxygenase|nr:dioxygenase [Candidatus Binataceae bacterium]
MEVKTVKPSARLQKLFDNLLAQLRQFIRDNQINHDEYRSAVAFLLETAASGELTLLSDVLLEATVDQVDSMGRVGTATSVEGPFYLPDSPMLTSPAVLPHRANEPGEKLFLSGTVKAPDGTPLAGAIIDIWQADAEGNYSHFNVPAADAPFNLRARVSADRSGAYEIQTWLPAAYQIPKDGPTGAILKATGRHPWRPAHVHFRISHPGFSTLTTQLFVAGDPWIDSDVVGAVKQPLIVNFERHTDPAEIKARGLDQPFRTARYDFILPTAEARKAA